MPIYQTKQLTVEAFRREDGRYAVLNGTDQAEHVAGDVFERYFEARAERRAVPRGRKATKRSATPRLTKRATGGRRPAVPVAVAKAVPTKTARPLNPKRTEAKRLWDAGERSYATIAGKVGASAQSIRNWHDADDWSDSPSADQGESTGVLRRCEECGAKTTRSICPKGHKLP